VTIPFLKLTGSHYAQGRLHGAELAGPIRQNLAMYRQRLETECRLPWDEAHDRAESYLEVLEAEAPEYAAAMQGIADGADTDIADIAVLNVRYELLYDRFGKTAIEDAAAGGDGREPGEADGCTAFAVHPRNNPDGHLLVGQNWDWIPETQVALVHTVEPDGVEIVAFTEAGIAGGKCGINSLGIGLAINGIMTVGDDWSAMRKPFHVRCWEILRAHRFDDAVAAVLESPRSVAANFLIVGEPDAGIDIEAAPDVHAEHPWYENGTLAHTNHFLDPDALGIAEPPLDRRENTYLRYSRVTALMAEQRPLSAAKMREIMSDTTGRPNCISRIPDDSVPEDERYSTIISLVFDVTARKLWVAPGPPDQVEYIEIPLDL
jgi:isopenicillin-N N-acyltransferase-like protein